MPLTDLETLETPWPADAVEVGRIVGPWGVKGWLKIQPFSGQPEAFFSSRRWLLQPAHEALKPPGLPKPPSAGATARTQSSAPAFTAALPVVPMLPPYPLCLKVVQAKPHADGVVAQVQGVGGREMAQCLKGARIFIPRSSFPTPEPGEYYWVDLIGLQVLNRQNERLGEVLGLMETGPHSVLQIVPPGKDPAQESAHILIPFVDAFVDEVRLPERTILVDWEPHF